MSQAAAGNRHACRVRTFLIMTFFRLGLRAPTAARGRLPSHLVPLFAPFLTALLPAAASAENGLDPVIVTGTREPQALSRSTADVVLIDAATIRNSSADSVEDLLRREAGLQIARNGGPGQSSGYFVRGVGASGTVVLVDGVRVGSATLGQTEFESLGLGQIDHIEVLRGPASSLYGADGVGGVVQIFTRRGNQDNGAPQISGGIAIGGYHSRTADIGISGSQGAFDYAATLDRDSSRGVSAIRPGDAVGYFNPDADGYQRNAGNLRLGYTPAPGHRIGLSVLASRLGVQYDSADFNPPTFAADSSPDFRNRLSTKIGSVDYRGEISPLWTTTLQASQQVDDSNAGGTTPSRFRTERSQGTWQNALHLAADQQLMLAYEYLHETVKGDAFVGEPSRGNNAVVAGYAGRFDLYGTESGLEASLRHDNNSIYGGDTTGNIGMNFEVLRGLKLRALAGTTFRAPTFNDLFYPLFGITTLKPESGRSIELGVNWQSGTTSASATLYRNRVRDLIGYDPDPTGIHCPAGYFGCAANTSRARLEGATLSAVQRWAGIDFRASLDFLDAKDADTGVRLARRAAHQETLAADYDAGSWRIGASVLDIGARPDGGETLGGYATVDLRATWRFLPKWRLEAKLLNALDHRVEPLRDYQGLGRQGWIGLRFDGVGL